MNDRFKGKYRIESTRLQNWDYGSNGYYFITICTKNRIPYFGEIVNGKMKLSQIGILADVFLYEIKNHSENVELGEFVVMPNHIHLILILKNDVETRHALSQRMIRNNKNNPPQPQWEQEPQPIGKNRFQNQGKNTVSSIIGSYKSAVTKHAHRLGFEFAWQSRFHDRIIRDEPEYYRIANYIKQNTANWEGDKNNV